MRNLLRTEEIGRINEWLLFIRFSEKKVMGISIPRNQAQLGIQNNGGTWDCIEKRAFHLAFFLPFLIYLFLF